MNRKYPEAWKQDGSCSVRSKGTIQVLKEKEIELLNKNVTKKKRKVLRRRM